jgi:hypothetical protein
MTAQTHSMASLLAERERLRAALLRFAQIAPIYARSKPEQRILSTALGDLTVDDLRIAREALESS